MRSKQNKVDLETAETSDIEPSFDLIKEQLIELQSRLNVKRIEFISTAYNHLLTLGLNVKNPFECQISRPIQYRILCILFFRLNIYYRHITNCDIIDKISTFIQLSVSNQKEISQNMEKWIKKGEKYQLLSKDLGGPGNLLVLPENRGESFWTKDVPKVGKRRDELIKSLLKRGIHRQAYRIKAHKTTISILNDHLKETIYSFLELLDLSQWKGRITFYYDPEVVDEKMKFSIQPENWNAMDASYLIANKTSSAVAPQRSEPVQNTMSIQRASGTYNSGGNSLIQNNIILPPINSLFMQSHDREGKRKRHLDTNDTISISESTSETTFITSRKRMMTSHAALDPSPPNTQAQRNIHSGSSEDQDRAANLMHESRSLIEESGYTRDKHLTSQLDPLAHVPDSASTIGENQYQPWPSTSLRSPAQPLPDLANGENQSQLWPSTSVRSPIQPSPTLLDGTFIRVPGLANGGNQSQSWPSTSLYSPTEALPTLLDGTSILHVMSQNDTEPANDLNSSTTVHPADPYFPINFDSFDVLEFGDFNFDYDEFAQWCQAEAAHN